VNPEPQTAPVKRRAQQPFYAGVPAGLRLHPTTCGRRRCLVRPHRPRRARQPHPSPTSAANPTIDPDT
jgi:hypothetical protein